jgi:molybdate transport system regulatory protein
LWFNRDDNVFLGRDRIKLLEKIGETGSITQAAKAVGTSYKNAWDIITSINNMAEHPIVESLAGGKGGGGTILTKEGKRIVTQFNLIQDELATYMGKLEEKLGDTTSLRKFLRRNAMNVSARNIFHGTVTSIANDAVNAEVVLTLKDGVKLESVVTNGSINNLELAVGMDAYAIVKANSVIVGTDLHDNKISSQNILCGTVARFIEGPITTEVDVDIDGGTIISAVITNVSLSRLDLKQGDHACTLFKASSVILGVN